MTDLDISKLARDDAEWVKLSYAVKPIDGILYPKPISAAPDLYPFQGAASQQAIYRKHIYCGHHPGAGKTPIALAVSCHYSLDAPIVVVAPPPVASQWAFQGRRWTGANWYVATTGEAVAAIDVRKSTRIVIPDSLLHRLPMPKDRIALLIADEAHRFKNPDAERTQVLLGHKSAPCLAQYADKMMFLSGTPVPNSPVELWPVLHAALPSLFPKFAAFCERYCPPQVRKQRVTLKNGNVHTIERIVYDVALNTEELAHICRAHLMLRPKRADVLGQLPPVRRDTVHIGPKKQRYDPAAMRAAFEGQTGSTEAEHAKACRRESGLAKVDDAARYLETLIDGGDAPLVFCHHRDVALQLAEKLGVEYIHGGMDQATRIEVKDRFVRGDRPALVCTLGAAGTGIDGFQTRTDLLVYVERDFVPMTMEQADGRILRAGQTKPCRIVTLVSNDGIDAAISGILYRKDQIIKEIVG